jgi:hypothetical protein
VGVALLFGLAACGSERSGLEPDLTVEAPVVATIAVPDSTATETTAAGPSPSSTVGGTTPDTSGTSGTAGAPTTGAPGTTAKPGATTTTVKPSATTTTVKVTTTTARPPATTVPAPPTTKPASNPGTFTATVANKSHRTLNVPYNATVVLTVTSATDEEFHVHGFDITKGGTNVTFVFTADMKGSFVVESHDTGWVVCTLVVA